MLRQLILQISGSRIGFQLGKNVPDSGQEHTANSNNGLFVSAASLDSALSFFAFRIFVRLNHSIGDLNQERFQVDTSTGNACGLDLF